MNFLGGSFRVARLFGIDIRVHVLFLLYIAFRVFDAVRAGAGSWQHELVFLGLLFGIVLAHEFGHCFGARSVGGYAENILMWPLGGLAYAHAPMRPWPQFVTVACGPLVNLGFCVVSGLIVLAQTHEVGLLLLNPFRGVLLPELNWLGFVWVLYQVNLLLLAFNLLPIYPLDGGQLFQAIIWPFLGLQRATLIACQVGLVGCVIFGLLGLRGGGGGMLFFIAVFGGFTCWQRLQAARQGLIVEDPSFGPHYYGRDHASRGSLWSRLFGRRRPPGFDDDGLVSPNPNPGGWETRQAERAKEDAELDRILQKVSAQGIHSLSYVERQMLERITRERQRQEHEFQRDTRL
jgi:Zn-dependent protease